jgi:hypothetical protein
MVQFKHFNCLKKDMEVALSLVGRGPQSEVPDILATIILGGK